jgi:hypothetical protein
MSDQTADFQAYAQEAALAAGVDPALLSAQINQESGWNPQAVSPAGCIGIAQICDAVPFDATDPFKSIDYMAARMASALKTYNGNQAAALASYNCGNQCANDWTAGLRSLPAQTRDYIAAILGVSKGPANPSPTAPLTAWTAPSIFGSEMTVFAPSPLSSGVISATVACSVIVLVLLAFAGPKRANQALGRAA